MQYICLSALAAISIICSVAADVIHPTKDTFQAQIIEASASKPVIVDFGAEWCQPCQNYKPVFEQLAQQYGSKYIFAAIDISHEEDLAKQCDVNQVPTVILFYQGRPYQRFLGGISAQEFEKVIEQVLAQEPQSVRRTQKELNDLLLQSIITNNAQNVQKYIREGADVNNIFSFPLPNAKYTSQSTQMTPLVWAAKWDMPPMVQLLLEQGASLDVMLTYADGKQYSVAQLLKKLHTDQEDSFKKCLSIVNNRQKKRRG